MRVGRGDGVPESTAFSQELSELKQNGCNVLLVGESAVHQRACRHLLGEDGSRRRLFVFTQGRHFCAYPPHRLKTFDREIVKFGSETNDSATSLGDLGTSTVKRIRELEARAGGFSPGELRLCFDSLGPLFFEHDPEQLFRLLHVITSRVRQGRGIGHYHLRIDRSSDHVNLLEPLFDALLEVRTVDGDPEQRWHLLNSDLSSDWVEF